MLDRELSITVPGRPATKGSLKCIGRVGTRAHVLIEDHKSSKPWRAKVVDGVRAYFPAGRRAVAGQPVGVEMTLTIERPKSHYGTGANRHHLKPAYVNLHPVGRNTGDLDKLARLLCDALQDAEVFPDDAAIVELTARKAYVGADVPDALPWPGAKIRVYPAGASS